MRRIAIVTPVYNDWPSFARLIADLERLLTIECESITVVAVDDGSHEQFSADFAPITSSRVVVKVVELSVNLGHQRAIAIGLSIAESLAVDCIVVMDSDGEDSPSDIPPMLAASDANPSTIIVAQRAKRSEGAAFRFSYLLYKCSFYLLTGSKISHGNFCLIPKGKLRNLLHSSHTWNNLAASITRSRLQYHGIPTHRGKRYEGSSKMNFISLLVHGLSAVSVYLDVLTARVIASSFAAFFIIGLASMAVIFIRFFTQLAIPGWTTLVLGVFAVITLQILMLAANTLFSHLNNRGQPSVIPATQALGYIKRVIDL